MKTIAEHFQTFSAAVIPVTAGPRQRDDMKMAFYGGASVMLTLLTVASGEDNDDIAVTRLAQLEGELHTFAHSVEGTPR
jgi:hypothetical protein